MLLYALACADPSYDGATPMMDGDGFFDRPFPSDSRMIDGHPDLSEFPEHDSNALIQSYLLVATQLDGWGNNSPLYVRFEDELDTSLLPSPDDSLAATSPIWLVDVDTASPHYGERVPVQTKWTPEETNYQPGNLLAIAPVWGFPLRPKTTYALVLFPPLARPGAMPFGWTLDKDWAPLTDLLLAQDVDLDTVAAATIFTTQDPVAETARVAKAIHEEISFPPTEPELSFFVERLDYTAWQGHVTVPVWQWGDRPYHDTGGGFAYDEDGTPLIHNWERVRFTLTIPDGEMPAAGWPVVLYSHGTGGDDTSFISSGDRWDEGQAMAADGVAMIGISQPLHADRGTPDTNVELDSFNYFNPDAGRTNFRQGALDQVYLAQWLASGVELDGGVRFDPARVAFFGHSQGGLVGAIAAPFMANDLVGAGFSGTGGGLAMTIVLRKDPLDIADLLSVVLDFDEGEVVDIFHPAVGLVQLFTEVTDPLNYGSWWFAEDGGFGGRPLPIEMTEGLNDQATPSPCTEALAAAGRVPIVGEPATDPDGLRLRGLGPIDLPTSYNATDWTGAAITAGLGQYPDQDHYAIYQDNQARALYADFLISALDGDPELQ